MNQQQVPENPVVTLDSSRVAKQLAVLAAFVIALDLLALAFALISGHDSVFGLLGLLDLDKERGVGMLFQVLLLLTNAALFYAVAVAHRKSLAPAGPWRFLACVFVFLSLDEFAFVHERLMTVMSTLVSAEGFLTFSWIIPYGIAVAVLAIFIGPRILKLPMLPRKLLLLAATVYLSGALGMEALGGYRMDMIGGEAARPELIYELLTTVEESLEIAGLILSIRALLELLKNAWPRTLVELT